VTGSTMFNADVAAECIKAAQDYNCWSSTAVRNVCGLVVSGTVPIGGSCRVDTECAQSPTHAVCLGSPGQCTADSFFGRAGAPCAGFALDCATYEGLRCITGAQDPKTGTCQPRSQAGEPCTYSPECQDGLYCDTAAGSCAPVKNLGDACTGPGCGWDAVCTNGVCTLYVVGEEVCVPATAASAGPQ
jgi:hypothetical protein